LEHPDPARRALEARARRLAAPDREGNHLASARRVAPAWSHRPRRADSALKLADVLESTDGMTVFGATPDGACCEATASRSGWAVRARDNRRPQRAVAKRHSTARHRAV